MKKLLKLFLLSSVPTVLFLLSSFTALAASLYGVTETTATVGSATNLEIEYTVDTADQTWADGDTLTVQLPGNLPTWGSLTFTAEYDSDTDNDASGETAITAGGGNGQYAVSGDTITIKWDVTTWGAVADGASTIRILVTAGATPQYADSTSTFTFGGTTAAGDTDPSGTDDVNVSAADAAATITLGDNAVVGVSGDTTLGLTIPIDLASSDTVVFTMPANLDVSSVAFSSDTFGGAGSFACADAAQVITCTADGAITAGTANIVMSGVLASYVASSQTVTSLAVNDVSASGADISSDSSGTVTDTTVGAFTSASITLPSQIASQVLTHTYSLTNSAKLPNTGKILITYPSGWDVSGVDGSTAANLSGIDGTWNATVSSQTITLTQVGGSATAASSTISFTLDNIRTTTTTGSANATITTTTSSDANIETDATVSLGTVVSGNSDSGTAPNPPSSLSVTENANMELTLTWLDPTSSIDSIEVLRGLNGVPVSSTPYAYVSPGVQQFTDTGLAEGDTVTYTLRARSGSFQSALSSEVTHVVGSGVTSTEVTTSNDTTSTTDETTTDTTDTTSKVLGESTVMESTFPELEGHESETEIRALIDDGIITGNDEGSLELESLINRAEAAAIIYRLLGISEPVSPTDAPFPDVEQSTWYAGYVSTLKELGLIHGNPDGTFEPAEHINRVEMLALAANVYEYLHATELTPEGDNMYADVTDLSAWYLDLVISTTEQGLFEGMTCGAEKCLYPDEQLTRSTAMVLIYLMFY